MLKNCIFTFLLLISSSYGFAEEYREVLATGEFTKGGEKTKDGFFREYDYRVLSNDVFPTNVAYIQLCINGAPAYVDWIVMNFYDSLASQQVEFGWGVSFGDGDCSEMIAIDGGVKSISKFFIRASLVYQFFGSAKYTLYGYKKVRIITLGNADIPFSNEITDDSARPAIKPAIKLPVNAIQFCSRTNPIYVASSIGFVNTYDLSGYKTKRLIYPNVDRYNSSCTNLFNLWGSDNMRTIIRAVIHGVTIKNNSSKKNANIELLGYIFE